jgi:hypothetical protein
MGKKKLLISLLLPLLLASFLQSQSLAELAKKEKERRAALKGKEATVTTSADLAKVKRRPAVESAGQELTAKEAAAQAGQADVKAQRGTAPPAAGQQAAAGAEEAKAAAEKPAEEKTPGEAPAMSEKEFQAKQAELVEASKQKQEMFDLLTLKLNTLYQEFYGLDNMKSREILQIQISDTYDKLLKAEAEANKANRALDDFVAKTKRENVPDIWIR